MRSCIHKKVNRLADRTDEEDSPDEHKTTIDVYPFLFIGLPAYLLLILAGNAWPAGELILSSLLVTFGIGLTLALICKLNFFTKNGSKLEPGN